MRKIILALLLISTPAAAQQWPPQQWGQPQRPQPKIVPQGPNGTIATPDGMISRQGAYVLYPDGSSAIINQQGLSTWSNGAGCRTSGNTTYCW